MKYGPIKLHIIYILCTLIISFWGPRDYENYNKASVSVFMFFYLLLTYCGFFLGVNTRIQETRISKNLDLKFFQIVNLCIRLSVILFCINLSYLVITGKLSLTSMGENYKNYYESYKEKTSEGQLFTFELFFLIVVSIPKFISIVCGFFYFERFSSSGKKWFIILLILIIFTQTFALGNQKSLGDLVIFGTVFLAYKANDLNKKQRNKILLYSISIMFFLLCVLTYSQYTRLSNRDISIDDINFFVADYFRYNEGHIIFRVFGPQIGFGLAVFLTGYLGGGYYGLSLCLNMPFEWTYGLGNSVALNTISDTLLGTNIYENTYLSRMEMLYGVPGKQHWHTIFPWLASDFTFYTLPILFGFISFLYGLAWRETLLYKNPLSYIFFCLLTVLFVFVPANNQIFHGFDYLLVSSTIFAAWGIFHSRFNYKISK